MPLSPDEKVVLDMQYPLENGYEYHYERNEEFKSGHGKNNRGLMA